MNFRPIFLSFLTTLLGLCALVMQAQTLYDVKCFDDNNSSKREAIYLFEKNAQGIYVQSALSTVARVEAPYQVYAYDEYQGVLYVKTSEGNFAIHLSKAMERVMKRHKEVPRYEGSELKNRVVRANNSVKDNIDWLNQKREEEIAAEKAAAEKREQARKREEAERLQREREEREAREEEAREEARIEHYRDTESWQKAPTGGATLECIYDDCGNEFSGDSALIYSISGRYLTYFTVEPFQIGHTILKMHKAVMPHELTSNEDFQFHRKVFADSIPSDDVDEELLNYFNAKQYEMGVEAVQMLAPYGYFLNWNWGRDPNLTFRCNFFNLDKRVVKAVEVSWQLLDADNNLLKSGTFRNNNADIQPFKWRGMWWEKTKITVPEDAARLSFTKAVIFYKNGQHVTLSGDDFYCNTDEDAILPGQPTDGEEYHRPPSGARTSAPSPRTATRSAAPRTARPSRVAVPTKAVKKKYNPSRQGDLFN